ncbi:MAG: radical SAM protein [Verrucomicrobiae bacterium]|nr:radical SAM protein [Verrucomicrobiae bacterium]
MDLMIVSPGNNKVIYQSLAAEYAAIEPPIWAALLAQGVRSKGYEVKIVDQEAEGLTPEAIAARVLKECPRLTAIVVYGQQPSASTQNMTMAGEMAAAFRKQAPELKTIMLGGHPSALPGQTLRETAVDFVGQGEGIYTLLDLLAAGDLSDPTQWKKVRGLWHREGERPVFTGVAPVVPEKELETALPGMAWDLLPMKAYRAHNWHCFGHPDRRQPYASLYTSLGCPFKCSFCCINAPFGRPGIRYWEPEWVIRELDLLAARYGVSNVKIADEMFVLNEARVARLCDLIIERGYRFNFWAYARVDTVKPELLARLKRAGFNWLCLGIESGSARVRGLAQKGRFQEDEICAIVGRIKDAGIHVLGNFIFGLPDDDLDSMQRTLDLALRLNCEMVNFCSAMAYPGSQLYQLALQRGWPLPAQWHDFSQHSYEQLPLPTGKISAGEVLGFRDRAWQAYFTNPAYLELVRQKFGQPTVDHLTALTKIKLSRRHAAQEEVV